MSRHPITDGWKIAASLFAGPIAGLVVLGIVLAFLFQSCRTFGDLDVEIGATRDTVRITDSVIVVRAETVTVRQKAVTRWDSVVRTITDTQVVILRDSSVDTLTVPPEMIAKDRAKDALIASLYGKDSTQEWRIATRDKLYKAEIAKANGPRWGVGVGLGYGCDFSGCRGPELQVQVNYQTKLPSVKGLLRKVF